MDQVKQNLQNEIDLLQKQSVESQSILKQEQDPDMQALLADEIQHIQAQIALLTESMASLEQDHFTQDAGTTDHNIKSDVAIVEIRAGTGGDEAGLFAAELYRMYQRLSEKKKWRFEPIFYSENPAGGVKNASAKILGKNVYSLLEHESGVHRVQRVPVTESGGRIHTSTATVAIMPELHKVEIDIKPTDLKWDFFRSGGNGGQNVNKVSTAVRLTHIPTGLVIECQEERSQGKNREKALSLLESRLYTMMQDQKVAEIDELRAEQVGTGERYEKIRTYNFPQDRITDHRLNESWHNLPVRMNGEIEDILEVVRRFFKDNIQS